MDEIERAELARWLVLRAVEHGLRRPRYWRYAVLAPAIRILTLTVGHG
jgi:hypothetical protein